MARALVLAREVAATDTTVLLTGETGSGKEVLARYIHRESARRDRVYLAVNCGALPPTLAESELFGHERGAFSGATERRIGHFEAAHGGTLVLDEVSELLPTLQVRLLRVLQEREVQRIGASRPVPVDVRIVATSNRDLRAMVAAGDFRKDLYYRLNVFPLTVPPLRERLADVGGLARTIVLRLGGAEPRPEALDALARHDWPGNVRELHNVIERALVLSRRGPIGVEHLVFDGPHPASDEPVALDVTGGASIHYLERQAILQALASCNGNRTHAARRLGISVRTLRNRLRDYRDEGIAVTPAARAGTPRAAGSAGGLR
ncbi:MAG: sigma-54-dependent Fis family transcriptional regulator [Deltaproteobacteria bacterium]|nr:sigma-54-dependent Fis family transcriptional regulator [Deltaproteobacteria bacterium]